MLLKICPDCKVEKPVAEFGRNSTLADGLQFYCRSCCSRRGAEVYRRRQMRLGKTVREKRVVPDGHKFCPACQTVKPHTQWHRTRRTKDGYASQCKDCRRVSSRRDYLKRAFGITEEERAALLAAQDNRCAICSDENPEHLDHDHKTGRIRGLLCNRCNMGLGLFADDPDRLRNAVDYLRPPLHVQTFDLTPYNVEIDSSCLHRAA